MASAEMKCLFRVGHEHHPIDTKKYGQPKFALYYAERGRFTEPGLYVWLRNKQKKIWSL